MVSQTVSLRFAYRILLAAKARGVSSEALVAKSGLQLPTAESADARIPCETYLRLWDAAVASVGDHAFAIDVATDVKASMHDVMGFSFMTSANLGEALQRSVRYLAIFTDSARWQRTEEAGGSRFTLVRSGSKGPAGPTDPRWGNGDLFALAELVAGARQVTGADVNPVEVQLTLPEPVDAQRHRAFFGAPVVFGAEKTSFLVDPQTISHPLRKADAELLSYFDRQAEARLERFDETDVLRRVQRMVLQTMGSEMVTFEAAAAQLGLSPRSLHRQLKKRGVTFNRVIDELRSSLAQQHLADPKLTIGEVAFLLGYSEPSAFHRAFLRWTGLTPQAFRGRR